MKQTRSIQVVAHRLLLASTGMLLFSLPVVLSGCDKDTSTSKSSTTKTTQTPEGTKQTTETTERTIEVEKKK